MTSSKNDKIKSRKAKASEDDEIPEDIARTKAKLEMETGKKYKYRPARKDLPSITHMLAHGAPESEGKPKTWLQLIGYPLALVIVFVISFATFQMAPHELSVGRKIHKFRLPPRGSGNLNMSPNKEGKLPKKDDEL